MPRYMLPTPSLETIRREVVRLRETYKHLIDPQKGPNVDACAENCSVCSNPLEWKRVPVPGGLTCLRTWCVHCRAYRKPKP